MYTYHTRRSDNCHGHMLLVQSQSTRYTNYTVSGSACWFFNITTQKPSADYFAWVAKHTFNVGDYMTCGQFLKANSGQPVIWKRASFMEEVLREADVISLHPVLDKITYHLVNKERLAMMKKEAILVNCSRGPMIDGVALVEHLRKNPMFRVGLDIFEDEPYIKPGLADMKNAAVVPHIASTSKWTCEGMATLAALNALVHNANIRFRRSRNPVIGDEFSSRHGQKGVYSQLWPNVDMPFSGVTGMRPDLIINPHAFPSRMTIAMLLESIAAKESESESNSLVDELGSMLTACGFNHHGDLATEAFCLASKLEFSTCSSCFKSLFLNRRQSTKAPCNRQITFPKSSMHRAAVLS
ncbi:Glycerate dehydrogenase HPR, peroxisomal [Capsicum annuum]|nr:Glycerate dehydrogenase HPR, peroxisomal [Capsicum annuum]